MRLGEHDLATEKDCLKTGRIRYCSPPVEDFGIENIVAHPEFNGRTLSNDVAIIQLDRTVQFKSRLHFVCAIKFGLNLRNYFLAGHIQPVCLPSSATTQTVPQTLTVAGWGTTESGKFQFRKESESSY